MESNTVQLQSIETIVHVPVSTAITLQVLQVLETSENGTISKQDAQVAIQQVAEDNSVQLNPVQTKALVEKVFTTASTVTLDPLLVSNFERQWNNIM